MRPDRATLKVKNNLTYAVFVAPAVLLSILFVFIPLIIGIYYSFRDWNGISVSSHFVGIRNYINALSDKGFVGTIGFTLKYALVMVAGYNILGLALAMLLNMNLKLKGILRAVYFMPIVIGTATVGYLWNFIIGSFLPFLGKTFGLGIFEKNWLAYPATAFLSLVIVSLWQGTGYYMIIYLAGLQGVPSDILEAAEIDGAGLKERFFKIIFPLIRPSITICLFLSIVNSLKAFDLNYSLTSGGPYGTTKTIAYQIFLDAFNADQLSYASAKAVIFSVVIGIVAIVQVKVTRKKEVEM